MRRRSPALHRRRVGDASVCADRPTRRVVVATGREASVGADRPTRFSTVPLAWHTLGESHAGLLLTAYT